MAAVGRQKALGCEGGVGPASRVRISKVRAARTPEVTQALFSFYGWENSGPEREGGYLRSHHKVIIPSYLLACDQNCHRFGL